MRTQERAPVIPINGRNPAASTKPVGNRFDGPTVSGEEDRLALQQALQTWVIPVLATHFLGNRDQRHANQTGPKSGVVFDKSAAKAENQLRDVWEKTPLHPKERPQ